MLAKILRLKKTDVDDWWLGLLIAVPGIAGTMVSFLYFGAGIWAVASIAFGRYPLQISRGARSFVLASLGYAAVLFVSSVANDGLAGILPGLIAGAPFYCVPLLLSRFRTTDAERRVETLCLYAALGAFLCLAPALVQMFVLDRAVEGGTGNGSVLGYVSAVLGAISLANVFHRDGRLRILAIAGFAAGMGALVLSQTRTLYLTVVLIPLALVVASQIFASKLKQPVVKWAGAVLLAAGGYALLWLFTTGVGNYRDALTHALGGRLELWTSAYRAIADAPWLGFGQLHKMDATLAGLPDGISYFRFSHAHNVWIDSALAGGIPAALFAVSIFVAPLHRAFAIRKEDKDRRVVFLLLALPLISMLNGLSNTLFTHDIMSSLFLTVMVVLCSWHPASGR